MTTTAPIRTYHPRQGRLTPRHRGVLADLGSSLGVAVDHAGDLRAIFGRSAPVVLEIGSGMGDATAVMAAADPDRDYLAVEVHRPGLANLLAQVAAAGLTNLRVVEGDALDLLRGLAPGALDAVHAFFPDPWPKARHHKRRLVQPAHVALVASRLRPASRPREGGTLHLATDDAAYAGRMLATLTAEPALSNVYSSWAPRLAARPVTKFEQRGLDAGRAVFDLTFRRTSA